MVVNWTVGSCCVDLVNFYFRDYIIEAQQND